MNTPASMGVFPSDVKETNPFDKLKTDTPLAKVSPGDKPWDRHKGEALNMTTLFAAGNHEGHYRYAERIDGCAQMLRLGWDGEAGKTKLQAAFLCGVRWCPVCGWRRGLAWKARMHKALPAIKEAHRSGRWLFLTLTVRNVDASELRETLKAMGRGWQRMSQRKVWPALGSVRATEVTHSDSVTGDTHPHFHALLFVPHGYFISSGYLEHWDWVQLWRQAMRLDYDPTVRIQTVRPGRVRKKTETTLNDAIAETLKYALKPNDVVAFPDWFLQITDQLHATKSVNLGGVLRKYLNEDEPETAEMIEGDQESGGVTEKDSWFFAWRELVKQYRFRSVA
jgi:plasmid rolling circle replication initiator protein Rep